MRRPSRRDALKLMKAAGASALVGCGGVSSVTRREDREDDGGVDPGDSCNLRPLQTEGPYFIDELLIRSDIRSDPTTGEVKEGVPLRLIFRVSELLGGACTPLPEAMVDLWQCDALGVYGDVLDGAGQFDTRGQLFLRGLQTTDAAGVAEFLTIYPGWYTGRTVHLHFKIRTLFPDSDFTSQLYFDDVVTDEVMLRAPYDARGPRSTLNSGDGIFLSGGSDLVLVAEPEGDGYVATFDVGVIR
jgi:protocatechuate 3,4-dioxygenase beta subunit